MNSSYITLSVFSVFVFLIGSSASKSLIKNLPGFDGDLPFTLETGYVGVGEDDELQFFYYFVDSQRDPSHDPLLFYLAGGPGTSGLFPLLDQIGPLTILSDSSQKNNITLEMNPYSWTKEASVIFVDIPAGVGFSYAKTWEASRSSDSILALHSYEFLKKWLVENPRFLNNQLYISGISYMGILVPTITLEAYNGNERGNQPQLNIKGCLILSPLTDKFIDFNSRFEYAHRLALISDDIYESTKETCQGNYVYNDPSNTLCSNDLRRVDECTSGINLENILEPLCEDVNPEPPCVAATNVIIEDWANDMDVQKALHVREGMVETWKKSNTTMHYDFKKNDTSCYSYDILSTIVYHEQLTDRDCHVLIIRYQMTYGKKGYSLTYATMKGAGHSVAFNKPKETSVILFGWLDYHKYLSISQA